MSVREETRTECTSAVGGANRLQRFLSPHRGQAVVFVAMFMVLALVGLTAVAVDGANYALKRRSLQNAADSAALAAAETLTRGGTASHAYDVAVQYAISNTAPYTITVPAYGSADGSGTGLNEGIEIDTSQHVKDVRVALSQNVEGYFTGIFGFDFLKVRARAHATTAFAGGVLPITVKRFNAGRTDMGIPTGETRIDYLAQEAGGNNVINSWPNPLYGAPSYPASSASPGTEVAMVGSRALANDPSPSNSFRFFVTPDVRQISFPSAPNFYHGVDPGSSVSQLKNFEADFVRNVGGWPTDVSNPFPTRGEQLGTFDGSNTGVIVDAIEEVYAVGDDVIVMIYDGTVHRNPDFATSIDPKDQTITNQPKDFQVYLWSAQGNFYSAVAPGTTLSVIGIPSEYDWWFNGGSHNTPYSVYIGSANDAHNPIAVTLSISRTSNYAVGDVSGFAVKAVDAGTGKRHDVGATIMAKGNPPVYDVHDVDFSFFSEGSFQTIQQGGPSASWSMEVYGFNGYGGSSGRQVNYTATQLDPRLSVAGVTATGGSVTIKDVGGGRHKTGTFFLNNTQNLPQVTPSNPYWIIVTATDGTSSHTWRLELVVKPAIGGSAFANTTDFVYVLGYARYRITSFTTQGNSKTLYGRAVSGLHADPLELTESLEARLVPWS
jgi:hypothetical protein